MEAAATHFWKACVGDLTRHPIRDTVNHLALDDLFAEEAGRPQPGDRRKDAVVIDFQDGFEQSMRGRVACHRDQLQYPAVEVRDAIEALPDQLIDTSRDDGGGVWRQRPLLFMDQQLLLDQVVDQRLDEQGRAAGSRVEQSDQLGRTLTLEQLGGHIFDCVWRKLAEVHLLGYAGAVDAAHQSAQAACRIDLLRDVRGEDEHGMVRYAARQVVQELDGGVIRPVQVVDKQRHRRLSREKVEQPRNVLEEPGLLKGGIAERLRRRLLQLGEEQAEVPEVAGER